MNILIVDDSFISRRYARRFIEKSGIGSCEYSFAEDGFQALKKIKAGGIDVLITDVNMSVMDGLELIQATNADPITRPRFIIVMTSAVTENLRVLLDIYGVDRVIKKPLSVSSFTGAFGYMFDRADTPTG